MRIRRRDKESLRHHKLLQSPAPYDFAEEPRPRSGAHVPRPREEPHHRASASATARGRSPADRAAPRRGHEAAAPPPPAETPGVSLSPNQMLGARRGPRQLVEAEAHAPSPAAERSGGDARAGETARPQNRSRLPRLPRRGRRRSTVMRAPAIREDAAELLNGAKPPPGSSPGSSPSPTRRAGSARPPPRSTSGPPWPSRATGSWSIDLDPQGNATTGLGIDARNFELSMYDVIMRDQPLEDCIEPTSVKNLFVAPATIDLAGVEIELVPAFSRELKLKRAIDTVVDDFDFVLIDCPPSLGLITVNGLAAADEVLVPIQCEYYALEGLSQLLRNVNLVSSNLNETLEVTTIVLTMYDARTRLSVDVANEVREHFAERVCRVRDPADGPPLRGALVRAADHGVRSGLAGGRGLPRAGQGGEQWRAAADSVRDSAPSFRARRRGSPTPSSGSCRSRTSGPTPSNPGATSTRSRWRPWPPPSGRWGCSSRSWCASCEDEEESYELIAGERRWRAARRAGLQTIPVLVQVADDVASLEQALVENLHRVDLNALEEAAAYQQLIDEFGLTHEQVATRMGKGRATVTNTLRLLQLPAGAQRALAERTISAGHARALLGTPDRALQEKLVERIVERGVDGAGGRGAGAPGGAELRVVPPEPEEPETTPERGCYLRYDRDGRPSGRRCASCPSPGCSSSRTCSRPISTPGSRSTSRTGGADWWSNSPRWRTSSASTAPWLVTAASRSSHNCQGSVQLHPQPVHDVVDCHLVHLPEALIA